MCSRIVRTILYKVIVAAMALLIASPPGFAQCDNLPRGDIVIEAHPTVGSLQQIIRNACRASGRHVLFDQDVPDPSVNFNFRGRVSLLFREIQNKFGVECEAIGSDTVFVKNAPLAPNVPVSRASIASIAQPSPNMVASGINPDASLDDMLQMKMTPAPTDDSAGGKKVIKLQGQIDHQSRLEPVQNALRVGTRINVGKLQSLTPGNIWARIPKWAGGTWKTVAMTAYYRYNFESGTKNLLVDTFMDKSVETLGWQTDRLGNLWHFVGTDFYTVSEGAEHYDVDFHKLHDVIPQDDSHFVVRHTCTRALVSKKTHKVERVFQAESINVYSLKDAKTLRCKSSIKEFDAQGRAASLQKGISYETKVQNYMPWNEYKGKDMRKLFAEYLINHGLADLL